MIAFGLVTAQPAWAAAPTITSFSPASGDCGSSVTIDGTGFKSPDVTSVKFNGTAATSFTINGAGTSITATVPSGATTGKISVTNADGTATSSTDFTVGSLAAPTITSFTPTAGPIGTSVTITGTNFCGTTAVKFNVTTATSVTVNSAGTSITASVPTGATTGKISVTNTKGTATSTTDFVVVAPPTITSFTPTFAPVGKTVTITGTNFSGTGFTTTSVKFNGVTATFVVNSATQITATVPTGATTGKITVTTPGGTATSATDFTVSTLHNRSVSLGLKKHLVASGRVSVADGFTACVSGVPVKIQRKVSGHWKKVASTTTTSSGSYKKKIKDKPGTYRAKATKVVLSGNVDICAGAVSPKRKNA